MSRGAPIAYDDVADLYDVYVTADYDREFFVAEASRSPGPVLELMAGTGRLSLPLLRAGVRLVCVDGSAGMVEVLRTKLAREGLEAGLHVADVRHLELSERFELILLPFQSFMELVMAEDQEAALAGVYRHLKAGGRFICPLHNPAIRRGRVDGIERIVGRFPLDGGTLVVSGIEVGGDPIVQRTQTYELLGPDGRSRWKRVLPMRFALIEPETFGAMAEAAGFRVAEVYGSYDRAPFDPRRSSVMVWILERPR